MSTAVTSDIATISRINAVPAILQVICETTGMRFAAVARVTDSSWTACAVLDSLGFGLKVGGELELITTLCHEIRASHQTIVIDKASEDEQYCNHHTPRIYKFESYISVPVFRTDGSFFGTICALDPLPAELKGSAIQPMMESFARLLSIQIESEENVQQTEQALEEERAIAELREQFIAVLGHDLRNPLFAITAGAELLSQRLQDEKSRAIAQHILTCGRRANQLVRDVLDFARGRLGNGIMINVQPCPDLAEALSHVASELQRVHPERLIHLNIGNLGNMHCDRERVTQLLSNLIANALTHGAADSPVNVMADIRDRVFVLGVHNQGEPIAPQVMAQLFQPFSRPRDDAPQPGLGLGLYIANQIALAHGGRMEVVSSAEAGTLFTFRLPLDRVEPEAVAPATP
ncbi:MULTISPECIES: GAF domain-containing sensor histidine kinase [Pseudomonas]|uniref:histidine kinase n=1 Tax=Pseudomonas donghuensis TaxID=1163398 RepID=A0AAP0X8W2_9PSED|nr:MULTISPECIES: ATP-binding protein [Pseudomonas]MDF9894925.1 signal transduction histidine kinase [Pseudomonas vranovensis]KDN97491.1 GAF domain-containing protein [Pseudomonas donghuensis]MBF4206596.1 GAF domain-containing protein [Pseudomonas donghuensis]MCP6690458.1 ATP-binding protein [Pseudomonas donghuensis]MCP6698344.1 ATP-binding protein [Pseudomonas donghuensis]